MRTELHKAREERAWSLAAHAKQPTLTVWPQGRAADTFGLGRRDPALDKGSGQPRTSFPRLA